MSSIGDLFTGSIQEKGLKAKDLGFLFKRF